MIRYSLLLGNTVQNMIKNDKWIVEQARQGMIAPFEEKSIRKAVLGDRQEAIPTISWGLSSYGYDIRLSPHDFRIFRHMRLAVGPS